MAKLNEKQFNAALATIKKSAEVLAQSIHEAGMFAIAQVNEHGNWYFGNRLIEAMGRKHDAQRVVTWLTHFGKFGVKGGKLCYRQRKDIKLENLDAWLEKAEARPYWELTAQKLLVQNVNYLSMLASIAKAYEKNQQKIGIKKGTHTFIFD